MQLATTTLTHAVSAGDQQFRLASLASVTPGMLLWLDGEAVAVVIVGLGSVTVMRGAGGTTGVPHAANVTVYMGAPSQFSNTDPEGAAPDYPIVEPWINLRDGRVWEVVGAGWVLINERATAANPFDQDLNTTDAVEFASVEATNGLTDEIDITGVGTLTVVGGVITAWTPDTP